MGGRSPTEIPNCLQESVLLDIYCAQPSYLVPDGRACAMIPVHYLPLETRTFLATKIGQLTPIVTYICKPTLPTISLISELADFIRDRSTTLFDLLKIPVDFQSKPDWHLQPEKDSVKGTLPSQRCL